LLLLKDFVMLYWTSPTQLLGKSLHSDSKIQGFCKLEGYSIDFSSPWKPKWFEWSDSHILPRFILTSLLAIPTWLSEVLQEPPTSAEFKLGESKLQPQPQPCFVFTCLKSSARLLPSLQHREIHQINHFLLSISLIPVSIYSLESWYDCWFQIATLHQQRCRTQQLQLRVQSKRLRRYVSYLEYTFTKKRYLQLFFYSS